MDGIGFRLRRLGLCFWLVFQVARFHVGGQCAKDL